MIGIALGCGTCCETRGCGETVMGPVCTHSNGRKGFGVALARLAASEHVVLGIMAVVLGLVQKDWTGAGTGTSTVKRGPEKRRVG